MSSGPGSHNFSGVLYGEYEVTVTLVGFDPYPKRVTIKSDEVTKLDLQLNLRGRTQNIAVKGGRTNQANTLVNSASVTDPFTGQAALSLPAVAVQSVQVLSNPFSAEYGRFASAVVDVNTRRGADEWKLLLEDPAPRSVRRTWQAVILCSWPSTQNCSSRWTSSFMGTVSGFASVSPLTTSSITIIRVTFRSTSSLLVTECSITR